MSFILRLLGYSKKQNKEFYTSASASISIDKPQGESQSQVQSQAQSQSQSQAQLQCEKPNACTITSTTGDDTTSQLTFGTCVSRLQFVPFQHSQGYNAFLRQVSVQKVRYPDHIVVIIDDGDKIHKLMVPAKMTIQQITKELDKGVSLYVSYRQDNDHRDRMYTPNDADKMCDLLKSKCYDDLFVYLKTIQ